MATYAIGIINDVARVPQIIEYLERIDATLRPYDGHFIIHGGTNQMFEGSSPGTVVVIEFPDHQRAEGWYNSPAYQEIIPLRAEHSDSIIFLIDGVDPDHAATDVIAKRYADVEKPGRAS